MRAVIPAAERFWTKVDVRGPDDCWEWQANRYPSGYGGFWTDGGRAGRWVRAHRFAYELEVGPIPDGLKVLHRCDNPPCVNPAHLFVGTDADNVRDKVQKGRHRAPQSCPHCGGSLNAKEMVAT